VFPPPLFPPFRLWEVRRGFARSPPSPIVSHDQGSQDQKTMCFFFFFPCLRADRSRRPRRAQRLFSLLGRHDKRYYQEDAPPFFFSFPGPRDRARFRIGCVRLRPLAPFFSFRPPVQNAVPMLSWQRLRFLFFPSDFVNRVRIPFLSFVRIVKQQKRLFFS